MKKIKIGNVNIEHYESIDELPVVRFHLFNKFLLVDTGIGSDLSDFQNHLQKIGKLIQKDQIKAIKELNNTLQQIQFISNSINPKLLCFAAMVKSINGINVEAKTEDDVKAISVRINEITVSKLDLIVASLKKKLKLS